MNGACLFFAIRGQNTDGHRFIDEVFRKNKHAIIVSENDIKENYKLSIQVKNINVAMTSVAKIFFRPARWTTKNSTYNWDKWENNKCIFMSCDA